MLDYETWKPIKTILTAQYRVFQFGTNLITF